MRTSLPGNHATAAMTARNPRNRAKIQDRAGRAAVRPQMRAAEAVDQTFLDYLKLTLTDGGTFDLLGVSYLQQLNDWLYWGGGLAAPLVEGNYGGFFAAYAALHAQKSVVGNWFVDAGLAVGAGAGGASVGNIQELSGSGAYLREYLGVGYQSGKLNFGVNYAKVGISNSLIDDSAISVFVQKPLSFTVGRYADAGRRLGLNDGYDRKTENMISFQYSNLSQIDPQGKYGGDIGLVSAQFSHFFNDDNYLFFSLDLGLSGLIWYNQAQGGIGRRFPLSSHINLYGQLGVGSGGWVTDTIDTGPGLIVYPMIRAEYLWSNGIGAYLAGGYLFAPEGSSRNWTVGAGLNYHLAAGTRGVSDDDMTHELTLRGVRVNLFGRKEYDIYYNGETVSGLDMAALQLDYAFNDHWYVPFQVAVATNDFRGYAGYVEGLVGLGWQSHIFGKDRLQAFAQVMYGMNDVGIDAEHDVGALVNGAIGINFKLNDQYAIYGQVGKTISLGQYLKPNFDNAFESTSLGLGLTYRFSLPTRVSR